MLLEFVNRLVELGQQAAATEIIPAGFRSNYKNGELETFDAPPSADTVATVASLVDIIDLYTTSSCLVFCHQNANVFAAIAVLDIAQRSDTVELRRPVTAQFAALETLAGGLSVHDMSAILRTSLYHSVPDEFIHAVSKIDWTASETHEADAATMGRQLTKTVAGGGSGGLPETVVVTLSVFDVSDALIDTNVHCAVVADHDTRQVAIVAIDGLEKLKDEATSQLRERIAERVNTDKVSGVVQGQPIEKMFSAGSPSQ